jgi:MOSC domain-containing protein YiiM
MLRKVSAKIQIKRRKGGRGNMDHPKGRVLAVSISETKGVPKENVPSGHFLENFGLEGDAHAGKWHRQVSLLAQESIDKMIRAGVPDLRSGIFAENITTENIILHELPVGTRLKIGETLQEVTQIGKECHHGCAIKQKVGKCIMPLEGIFTRVIRGGTISEGDPIEIC